jgi:hypothetical protein
VTHCTPVAASLATSPKARAVLQRLLEEAPLLHRLAGLLPELYMRASPTELGTVEFFKVHQGGKEYLVGRCQMRELV